MIPGWWLQRGTLNKEIPGQLNPYNLNSLFFMWQSRPRASSGSGVSLLFAGLVFCYQEVATCWSSHPLRFQWLPKMVGAVPNTICGLSTSLFSNNVKLSARTFPAQWDPRKDHFSLCTTGEEQQKKFQGIGRTSYPMVLYLQKTRVMLKIQFSAENNETMGI